MFTPFTQRPTIRDRARARRIVAEHYPQLLRDAGIEGTAIVWIFIDTEGKVRNTRINRSSGNPALDAAAEAAAREFEFKPARNRGRLVPVWVAVPIHFGLGRRQ